MTILRARPRDLGRTKPACATYHTLPCAEDPRWLRTLAGRFSTAKFDHVSILTLHASRTWVGEQGQVYEGPIAPPRSGSSCPGCALIRWTIEVSRSEYGCR